MLETKMFEVRDRMTYIPIIAIRMRSLDEAERYMLSRAGYGQTNDDVLTLTVRIEGKIEGAYSSYRWEDSDARTMPVAHDYIHKNWNDLKTGDVIDVEYILGETEECKLPERLGNW